MKTNQTFNPSQLDMSHLNSQPFPPAPRSQGKNLVYLSLILAGVGLGVATSYVAWNPSLNPPKAIAQVETNTPKPQLESKTAIAPNFIRDVVEKVGPAVVRIDASKTVKTEMPDAFNDPFFKQFFGREFSAPQQKQTVKGMGSGFIINSNGRIITNAHVVDGADTVTVTLKDGRTFTGKVLGSDSVTDVAVVEIKADNLPTVSLGNSEQIRPGDWAIAIGNPLGLDNTVTEGIISATGRSSGQIGAPDKRVEFIQTDAAINPGNSGGPLLNEKGEVVGMNTAIIQGAQGLGFAIPINKVQQISSQLVANGKVEHPYLGVQMVTLTPEIKQNINDNPNSGLSVDEDKGVLVVRIMQDSPAAKAGLRAGDVIIDINGQAVISADQVQKQVENSTVGSNLKIAVRRNGTDLTLTAQSSPFPAQLRTRSVPTAP